MSQMLAQTVFQGKAIDLTDTRDYGSLVAASLGQEWNGFGQSLFVQPLDLAWRQVLAPAAGSLNARWQKALSSRSGIRPLPGAIRLRPREAMLHCLYWRSSCVVIPGESRHS
jgi:hypothetical protein